MPRSKGTTGKISPERLAIVGELLKLGTDSRQIQHTLAERWGVTTRTIRFYEERVRKIWREAHEQVDPADLGANIMQRLEDLYFIARGEGRAGAKVDLRMCNQLLRTMSLIFMPQRLKVAHEFPNGVPVQEHVVMTPDQAKRELARRLAARLKDRG